MIDNKTIVLTGASSGIGLETLKLLAQGKGNRILAVSRHATGIMGFGDNVIRLDAVNRTTFPTISGFNESP